MKRESVCDVYFNVTRGRGYIARVGLTILLLGALACTTTPRTEDPMQNPETLGLQSIIDEAYGGLTTNIDPRFGIRLEASVASGLLDVENHHERFTERRRPEAEGYWFLDRGPERETELNFVPGPFFKDIPYPGPERSALQQIAVIDVRGSIDGRQLDYESFVVRFDWDDGRCTATLFDPALPTVVDFLLDDTVQALFPECEGPVGAAASLIRAAVPGIVLGAYDPDVGSFDGIVPTRGDTFEISTGDGCTDLNKPKDYKNHAKPICSDAWFGWGAWARGGSYKQFVDCVMVSGNCTAQTVGSDDDLYSQIRTMGTGRCDCCDEYGAGVAGGKNSASLISRRTGTTGGHVAIAKTPEAHRTSQGSQRSELALKGDCKGDLDLPAHGATAAGGGSVDYKSESTTVTNQAKVSDWDADSIVQHLCLTPSGGGT